MSRDAQLLESVAPQTCGAVFTAAVSFALTLFLARQLGPQGFSHYATWLNFGALALIAIEGGWPTLAYRAFAQDDKRQSTQVVLAAGLRHVACVTTLIVAMVLIAVPRNAWLLALSLAVCMAAVAAMNLVSAHMRGLGEFAREATWQSVGRAVSATAIALAAVVLPNVTAVEVFAAWSMGLLVVLATWGRRWLPALREWVIDKRAWSFAAWPFVPVALAGMWLLKADLLLLQGISTDKAMYAACTRLTEAGLLLFAPIGNVVLGRFSALAASGSSTDRVCAHTLARKLCVFAMLAGGAAVLFAAWWGSFWIDMFFGSAYADAGNLLPWVLTMLPFAWCNMVLVQLAIAQHQERRLLFCLLVCAVLLAVGLPLLNSWFGVIGAAIAVALCQAFLMLMLIFSIKSSAYRAKNL